MGKKPIERVFRNEKLTPEEVARDREIRRKVQIEFPPLEASPTASVLSHPLREAISQSGESIRQLAKKASVSEVVLQQFIDQKRDLRLATAERLAHVLGLKLVAS